MESLSAFLAQSYQLSQSSLTPMEGYDSTNFRVQTNGQRYVLKLYGQTPLLLSLLEAENEVLRILNASMPGSFPIPSADIAGNSFPSFENQHARLLSFLEGTFLAEVDHTPALFRHFGEFLARMNQALLDLRHPAIEARRHHWDLSHALLNADLTTHIPDPSKRKWADYFFLQFREQVSPQIQSLRHAVIHADANDWNLLTSGDQVTGLIDFGDMVYAPLVNELAIAMAYALFGKSEPLTWAAFLVEGYQAVLPLTEKELGLLYYLVGARLAVSVSRSAYTHSQKPDSEYITISEQPAWDLMEKWVAINPEAARRAFKQAAGFPPEPVYDPQPDLERRHQFISKALSVSFHTPIQMSGAAFQYMFDSTGNTYLDAYNNIPHVGHCHPHVVAAGQRQMAQLNTNTRYLYDLLPSYAERLLNTFPKSLNRIFFVNSGSAASDLAIRLAMTHTQRQHLQVMEHGYHGHTRLGIDISSYKFEGKGGAGQREYIFKAPIPDAYKGKHAGKTDAGKRFAQDAIQLLNDEFPIAAFISEPVVGCGGQVPLAPGYLTAMYSAIRERGGLCISDEVQAGFGRLGEWFWGFEMHEVVPDIVVMGKPMGNGHPMAAVVTTEAVAQSFENGMEFFSSFGGNPVSCAIGMAVLDVMETEGLQQHAYEIGEYLKARICDLQGRYETIGDVRGSGLFLGAELVIDRESKTPATALAKYIKNRMKEHFILVGTDGPADNVLKIKPPLSFDRTNADQFVDVLEGSLKGV